MEKEILERNEIIARLEIMKGHGQFEGFPEDSMNFSELDTEDLIWYKDNWFEGQFDAN